jgi:hypothetical protein
MRRLELDLIALPRLLCPQQGEIADKVPPRGVQLTELRRILNDRVADGDAAVARGEGQEPLKGPRNRKSDRPVRRPSRQRKRRGTVKRVLQRHQGSHGSTRTTRTHHLGPNRPVARGERERRPPQFATGGRRPQQPYLGVHGAVFRCQTQIVAIGFCGVCVERREHGRGDAQARVDDELAFDGVALVGEREKVGRFGFEGGRRDAAAGVRGRVRRGRLAQTPGQSVREGGLRHLRRRGPRGVGLWSLRAAWRLGRRA